MSTPEYNYYDHCKGSNQNTPFNVRNDFILLCEHPLAANDIERISIISLIKMVNSVNFI